MLDDVIGRGTDTEVHRARRLPGGQQVAIKVAAPHRRGEDLAGIDRRLRAEARLLQRLDHFAIVPLAELIDGGLDPGAGGAPVALVYPLAEDGTVADLVDRGGPVSVTTVDRWREQLTEALRAAHRAGIVHGDLSARSLLLGGDAIWLSGFGSPAAATATPDGDLEALEGVLAAIARLAPIGKSGGISPQGRDNAPDFGGGGGGGGGSGRPRPLPRPLPRPAASAPDRRPLLVGGLIVAGALMALALAAAWLTSAPDPAPATAGGVIPDAASPAAPPGTVDAPPAEPSCPGSGADVPAGAVPVRGDPAGAGCTVTVSWWPDRAEADRPESSGPPTRFVLGDPGDQLVLGDWDGDGRDTPALYDPVRGQLVRFDGWAEAGQSLTGAVDPTAVRTGGVAVVERRAGGDDIEIHPAPDG